MSAKTIQQQLKEARTIIENAMKNPEIQQKLQTIGYLPENLQKGKELLETAVMLHQLKRDCYGEQYEATDTVQQDFKGLRAIYKDHMTLAQIALRGHRGAQTKLGINQPLAKSRSGWTVQALNFYSKAPQYQKHLSRFGITKAEMEQALAAVEAFVDLQDDQTDKIGAAQRSTQQQQQALKDLKKWVRGFKAIIRVAMEEDDQLLEALGMYVPS